MKQGFTFLKFCLLTMFLSAYNMAVSQTNLTDGDIVFTRIGMDNEEFSFVFLADVTSGTTFYITDEKWTGSDFGNAETTLFFTATSNISAGEECHINPDVFPMSVTFTSGSNLASLISVGANLPYTNQNMLGSAGDQLFIFQYIGGIKTVISGVNANRGDSGTSGDAWNTSTSSTSKCQIPTGKTNGVGGFFGLYPDGTPPNVNPEVDNARYKASSLHSGDKATVLAQIMDWNNWEFIDSGSGYTPSSTAFSITGTTVPVSASITSATNVDCNGAATGSLTVTATDGVTNFNYHWSNGFSTTNTSSTTNSISNLTAGTYTVTVTDGDGNTATASTTVTQATALNLSMTVDSNATCNGYFNGGGTVNVSGGTPSYSYAWNNFSTSTFITGVGANTYTVTVTDARGCTKSNTLTITEPTTLTALMTIDSNVSCNGLSDGGATGSQSGGTPPYNYAWNNFSSTSVITGVPAGVYTVTVTDDNYCTAKITKNITEPDVLAVTVVIDSNASCNGFSDGGATASVTGGTSPFDYAWNIFATTASITGVTANTYTVTITDANDCLANNNGTITQPVSLVAATVVDSNASCNGFSDGGASASATGGTTPYNYAWSNGATTASITGVVAGTYTVTITDNNGCTSTSSSTVTEPAAFVAATIVDSNATCNGFSDGGASASATGGTPPYSYAWSNAATTASITGVVAGTYTVTMTDHNGCTSTSSSTITEPAAMVASVVVDSNTTCSSTSDGGLTASASGGTPAYSYAWSNGAVTASITGIVAGTYTVTITDNSGCTSTNNGTVTAGTSVIASVVIDSNVTCNGFSNGGATASASGGASPYTYAWSNSAMTASITGVVAGTYSVTITDNNGCSGSNSGTITEPVALIAATVVDSNVSCNGFSNGGASASATGGTTPYTYAWNNGATTASITGVVAGTYTVTMTDNNGCTSTSSSTVTEPAVLIAATVVDSNVSCNGYSDGGATASATGGTMPYTYAWSNGATTASITGVVAGTYSVTMTDNNGCTSTSSSTVTEPTGLVSVAITDSNVTCNGFSNGGATASATGGTMPYTYAWSNGVTTASITGVVAGTYSVTMTDNNGCTSTSSSTVTEPAVLTAATVVDSNVSCNGYSDGGATASATGGTMPYTYAWSNGATTASITGVVAGTYTVTMTDNNGCTSTSSSTVTEPAALIAASIVDSNVTCNGLSDGGATASATGGTMPYTYVWNNGATTASIIGVLAGTYTVTMTDNNGCTSTSSSTITEPAALIAASIVDSNVSCNGYSDGGATASATGGTMPYTYVWSNGATTASITGVAAGTYSVTLTDNNGCTSTSSSTVTEPAVLVASVVNDSNATCAGFADGGLTASATGGTMPYAYVWSNGATTASITGLVAGTYTVTTTDNNGCTSTATGTIVEIDTINPTVTTQDITVYLDGSGQASITASDIDNGSSDACGIQTMTLDSMNFDCSEVGNNTVTLYVTDVNNNMDSATATVTVMDTLAPIVATQDITVYLDGSGQVSITTSDIDNGSSDNCSIQTMTLDSMNFDCSEVGNNTVTLYVTDVNNNMDSATATVTVMDTLVPIVATQDITVYLDGSGQASITASDIDNGSSDNCSIQTMTLDSMNFDCSEVGNNTVTLYVTDVNNNMDSATATVTVMDTLAPIVATQDITVYLDGSGQASITTSDIDNGSSDNCSIQMMTLDSMNFDCSEVGNNVVTLYVTDVNNNMDSATATVTVMDTLAPIIAGQNISVQLDSTGQVNIMASMIDNGTMDNCQLDTIYLDSTSFACGQTGVNTVWFYAEDIHGNIDSASFEVTVGDTIAPSLVCPTDTTFCEQVFTFTDAVAWDNCSSTVNQLSGPTSGDDLTAGTYTFEFEVTDGAGNTNTCSFNATVLPNPVVNIGPADTLWGKYRLVELSAGNDPTHTYQWNDGSTDSTISFQLLHDTTVSVLVTSADGCTSTDTISISVNVGTNDLAAIQAEVSVYPNPVINQFEVLVKNWKAEQLEMMILSMEGKVVQYKNLNNVNTDQKLRFDTQNMSQGIYFLRISDGKNATTTKIVVQ